MTPAIAPDGGSRQPTGSWDGVCSTTMSPTNASRVAPARGVLHGAATGRDTGHHRVAPPSPGPGTSGDPMPRVPRDVDVRDRPRQPPPHAVLVVVPADRRPLLPVSAHARSIGDGGRRQRTEARQTFGGLALDAPVPQQTSAASRSDESPWKRSAMPARLRGGQHCSAVTSSSAARTRRTVLVAPFGPPPQHQVLQLAATSSDPAVRLGGDDAAGVRPRVVRPAHSIGTPTPAQQSARPEPK